MKLPVVIREFCHALSSGETYDPRRNPYIVFGLLWGLPVPILGVLVELHVAAAVESEVTFGEALGIGFHLFLVLHPPVFAVVFGAMGTVRSAKMAHIEALLLQNTKEMERLARAHRELEELTRLRDEMLGNVTHELKTPLVTIRGYAEMLRHERLGPLGERQLRALEVSIRNCDRLQQQIETLLAASRCREHPAAIDPVPVPLAPLLSEIRERHGPVAHEKRVELELEVPETPVTLMGEPVQIREILDNLLGNAIKFTAGGGTVRIRVDPPEEGRVTVEVVDTGCGIEEHAQEFIFDRFRQADGSIRRRYGGTGLGLSLVRANLLAHGCDVEVRSKPGEGTTFRFELPVATTPDDRETTPTGGTAER